MAVRIVSVALWAALALAVANLAGLSLSACGVDLFSRVWSWCPADPVSAAPAVEDELDKLQRDVVALERQLVARPACAIDPRRAALDRPDCFVKREAAPVVLAIDASGSMALPIDLDPAEDRRLQAFNRLPLGSPQRLAAELEYQQWRNRPGATRRIDVVNRSVADALTARGADARTVIFRECGIVDAYSGGGAADAARGLAPQGGTDIVGALRRAAAMLPPTGQSTILLVSDGSHTCQGDVCAVTRELKSQRPGLVVNVVDLAGWAAVECIARESGGILRRANNMADIGSLLNLAAEAAPSGRCDSIEQSR